MCVYPCVHVCVWCISMQHLYVHMSVHMCKLNACTVWYVSIYVCTLVYVLYVCSVYAIPVLFDSFLLMEMVCGCTYHGNANERQVQSQ